MLIDTTCSFEDADDRLAGALQLSPKKGKSRAHTEENGPQKKTTRRHFPETKAAQMIENIDKGKSKDIGN